MFRKILVPVDGSTFAEHALVYAAQAAGMAGSELHLALVHVRYAPASTDVVLLTEVEEWERTNREREADYLEELAARVQRDYGIAPKTHLLSGEIVPSLGTLVKKAGIELVVITTHGRSGLDRAWLGSVADALVRELEPPVLLIRPSDEEPAARSDRPEYGHVVIALDGSERAEKCVRPALALAGAEARVTLLRIVSPPGGMSSPFLPHAARMTREREESAKREAHEYLQQALAKAGDVADRVETVVAVAYSEARGILDFAEQHAAGLIALGTHGRNPVARLVLGSVSDKVVRAAPVPVLVC